MGQLRDRLIAEMRQYFGEDKKRIQHALKVTEFAEEILKGEKGDGNVVIAAAILHDIGIHEAERKYGSSAGHYQEIEGPPIAREIMKRAGLEEAFVKEVCEIIGNHHSPRKVNTINFKILYDSDLLVNLGDKYGDRGKRIIPKRIDRIFMTSTGKKVARKQEWGK